jgi:endonuclease-3
MRMKAADYRKDGDAKKRAAGIVRLLKKHYPDAGCTLSFETVHQLMVATILSAQCTDERVNLETPALFRKYRSVSDFARAELNELAQDIRATGFHNAKAKAIKTSAQQLMDSFGGQVPDEMAKLVTLQGVGRKTASVILGAGFGLAEGIAVDTHVGRISRLLGFTRHTDPTKIERDLQALIPRKDWIVFSHLLIRHGRTICRARRPDCGSCFLKLLCPSAKP